MAQNSITIRGETPCSTSKARKIGGGDGIGAVVIQPGPAHDRTPWLLRDRQEAADGWKEHGLVFTTDELCWPLIAGPSFSL